MNLHGSGPNLVAIFMLVFVSFWKLPKKRSDLPSPYTSACYYRLYDLRLNSSNRLVTHRASFHSAHNRSNCSIMDQQRLRVASTAASNNVIYAGFASAVVVGF